MRPPLASLALGIFLLTTACADQSSPTLAAPRDVRAALGGGEELADVAEVEALGEGHGANDDLSGPCATSIALLV